MAGYGTKKPGAELGVALTFPGNFSRAYKQMRLGDRYAPSGLPEPAKQEYVGEDFQALLHMQRREEAHHMVRAAVHATKESRRRAFSSHCGYYGLPDVVLTQRVRGSNFGVGGGGGLGYPNPLGLNGAGLEGGVIGSREGRVYVKDALRRRKAQLDAIDASILEGPTIQAQVEARAPNDFSELSKIELLSYLDQLNAQIEGEQIQFTPDTFRKFLTMLVRFAVVADPRELEQITAKTADVLENLQGQEEDEEDGGANPGPAREKLTSYRETLTGYMVRALRYLQQMFRGLSMSAEDRKALSKSLLMSLKFGEISKELVARQREFGKIPSFRAPEYRAHGGDDDLPGDDDEGGDDGDRRALPALSSAGVSRGTGARGMADGMFSRQPISAELSGGPRFQLPRDDIRQPDVRDRFGAQGQAGEARAQRRYAGEEEGPGAQDEEDFQGDEEEEAEAAGAPAMGQSRDLTDVFSRLRDEREEAEREQFMSPEMEAAAARQPAPAPVRVVEQDSTAFVEAQMAKIKPGAEGIQQMRNFINREQERKGGRPTASNNRSYLRAAARRALASMFERAQNR